MRVFTFLILTVLSFEYFSQSTPTLIHVRKPKEKKCFVGVLGKKGGEIKRSELLIFNGLEVNGSCDFRVISFKIIMHTNYNLCEYRNKGPLIVPSIKIILDSLPVKQKFWIEDIEAVDKSTGKTIKMPDMKFKVVQ